MSDESKRIALVIGNSNYEFASPLKNPVNDANALGAVLKRLGFTAIVKKDLDQKNFKTTVREFGCQLKESDTVVFYFAGHGMQVNGINYLIPIDANPQGEGQVDFESINANWILSLIEDGKSNVNIMILDACRNNPFKRSWNRGPSREGLSFLTAPKGTLIAFSTAPDKTASDGDGENSPYTSALVAEIVNPALTVNQLFQGVRKQVLTYTKGNQIPWESTSLLNDFHFNTGQYISLETFCDALLYNNENDRVLNHLLLELDNLKRVKGTGINISEHDLAAGVIEVYTQWNLIVFDLFTGLELKLFKDGERQYNFYTNDVRSSKVVRLFSDNMFIKLGDGIYDDERHQSFRNMTAIDTIARGKAKESMDECFTHWYFDRVSFVLHYTTKRQLIFKINFRPKKRVVEGNIFWLFKLNIQHLLDESSEIERDLKDGEVRRIDYAAKLAEPEFGIFNEAIIRVFGTSKIFEYSLSINLLLKASRASTPLKSLIDLATTLTGIFGPDSSGNGYLSGAERKELEKGEFWSGRSWDLNLQHQFWDPDSASEFPLYSVYLNYDQELDEFDLSIMGYNRLAEYFNQNQSA